MEYEIKFGQRLYTKDTSGHLAESLQQSITTSYEDQKIRHETLHPKLHNVTVYECKVINLSMMKVSLNSRK